MKYLDQPGFQPLAQSSLTLRDYFAAKALPAVYKDCIANGAPASGEGWRVGIAIDCYAMADAMMEARNK